MDLGIDYAAVDGNAPPDLPAARRAGLSFAIIRASYSKWKDATCARDGANVRAAGAVLGGYAFFDPDEGAPAIEEQMQAAYAGASPIPGRDLPLTLDVELSRGLLATREGPDLRTARVAIAGLVARGRAELRRLQGGIDPLLYISARVADTDDTDTFAGALDDAIRGMAAWLARYVRPTRAPAETSAEYIARLPPPPVPKAIGGADDWWFRQYAGDALRFPGFSSTVDCDVFNPCALGAHGTRVMWIQARVSCTIDGGFGPDTLAAVKAFQARAGLPVTGVVDLATFVKLAWTRVPSA